MDAGTRIEFTGYPSYLQGKKGRVVRQSDLFEEMIVVEFDDGAGVVTESQHVQVIEDGKGD